MTVKLIAADMDGTLLDSNHNLSPYLFNLIKQLKDKNIKFAIASGRQYYNLLKNFDDIKDDLFYIADNGSNIYYKGQSIYIEAIDKEELKKVLKDARLAKDMYPVISGVESAYIEDRNDIFVEEVKRYNEKLEIVDDLLEVIEREISGVESAYIEDRNDIFVEEVKRYNEKLEIVDDLLEVIEREKICKFSAYDMIDAEKYAYNIFKKYNNKSLVCVSGKHWSDIMSPKANKGEAIKILQEKYNISYDETMAFGDYLNDYEMMQSCKYSYAMDNAHPKLKDICNYRAKSNDEDGVVDAIRRHFNL